MRTLCSSTLIGEFMVIGFAGLVAMQLSGLSNGTIWLVSGVAMVLCLLLCGLLRHRWAVGLGWLLQAGLVLSGLVLPVMYFLGAVFAGVGWAWVHLGRKVDEAMAARAAAVAAAGEGV
jgi:hypothetical protein